MIWNDPEVLQKNCKNDDVKIIYKNKWTVDRLDSKDYIIIFHYDS